MSNVLTDIETNEVSLVTRGANRKRFALRKEDDVDDPKKVEKLHELTEKARAAVAAALKSLREVKDELPAELMAMIEEKLGAHYPDSEKAGPDRPECEYPADNPEGQMTTKTDDVKKTDVVPPPAELSPAAKEQIAKAEADAKAATATAAELKKSLEESDKKRVELEKQIAKERDERLNREFIAKAALLKHLPAKADELGPILKALNDVAPEQAAKIEKVLEAANTKCAKVEELTKQVGRGGGDELEQSAWGQLKKHAAELRKTDPKLTEEQAVAKATELHPSLYEQYNREQTER